MRIVEIEFQRGVENHLRFVQLTLEQKLNPAADQNLRRSEPASLLICVTFDWLDEKLLGDGNFNSLKVPQPETVNPIAAIQSKLLFLEFIFLFLEFIFLFMEFIFRFGFTVKFLGFNQ